jgi:SecD/SecF fusion protein
MIILVMGVCLWSIWPTWQVHSLPAAEKDSFIRNNPKVAAKSINFGLDLAGGTHVVVEMDTSVIPVAERTKALDLSLEILRNRVDKFGLSEPQIAISGENRIVADLAGMNAEQAREIIGSTAKLEFKLVLLASEVTPVMNRIDDFLLNNPTYLSKIWGQLSADSDVESTEKSPVNLDLNLTKPEVDLIDLASVPNADGSNQDTVEAVEAESAISGAIEQIDLSNSESKRPFYSLFAQVGSDLGVPEGNVEKVRLILEDERIKTMIPPDMELVMGRGFETIGSARLKLIYALKKRAEMDGTEIRDAREERVTGSFNAGEMGVNLTLGGSGPKHFAQITGNNIGRQLAIVLDNQVVSAPNIKSRIQGSAQITGMRDASEAKQLAVILRAGALPAPMKIVELRNVGASLGEDNINSGIKALVIGLALVVAFMIFYYLGAGIKAIIALIFNLIIIVAVMSTLNATLTLPGIAGIILTIGMAVDANVIIYERIREELKLGRSARSAISAGFEKAFSTIIDANITTFLTAMVLYFIGTGPIKGFGLTLMIGIASTLFSSLYVTRYFFLLTSEKKDSAHVSIGKGVEAINEPKIDVLSKKKLYSLVSGVLIALSLIALSAVGLNYSIDFTGGHIVSLGLDQPMPTEDLRSLIVNNTEFKQANVRTISSNTGNHYLITLDNQTLSEAANTIQKVLTDNNVTAEILNEDMVGPSIGKELRWAAIKAILLSMLIIILYVWVRFGRFGLGFGLGAVLTLAHDVILTLGIFSVLKLEVDTGFVAAILTIVGYSLNDTIVVFDRIRENTNIPGSGNFEKIVNTSVNQSISRTIVTSLTTLFVTVVLTIWGGASIKEFALAMSIGIVVGTYSTICVASPFVVWWTNRHGVKKMN